MEQSKLEKYGICTWSNSQTLGLPNIWFWQPCIFVSQEWPIHHHSCCFRWSCIYIKLFFSTRQTQIKHQWHIWHQNIRSAYCLYRMEHKSLGIHCRSGSRLRPSTSSYTRIRKRQFRTYFSSSKRRYNTCQNWWKTSRSAWRCSIQITYWRTTLPFSFVLDQTLHFPFKHWHVKCMHLPIGTWPTQNEYYDTSL